MKVQLSKSQVCDIWISAQGLNVKSPFGSDGAKSVALATKQLGYIQIDTINVIERCHHHILYNRIPKYKREHLAVAQSINKTIFEYWTHALSYVAVTDLKYFVSSMKNTNTGPGSWFGSVTKADYLKVKNLLKKAPVSIRDIKDDTLKEKRHEWDSKKPSKLALQLGFYNGDFVVSAREGMLKKYDLTTKHFGIKQLPKPVSETEQIMYVINRALTAQGVVSVDSICHLAAKMKPLVLAMLNKLVSSKTLVEVEIIGASSVRHWVRATDLENKIIKSKLTHILSPFDPLIIQRKRLKLLFDYEHLFEAYIPKEKRKFGYFSLPALHKNEIIALLDLKTDRQNQQLLIQNWAWLGKNKTAANKKIIEAELDKFEKFQLAIDLSARKSIQD